MTRYKKRKISRMLKFCTALVLPFTVAVAFDGAQKIDTFLEKTKGLALNKKNNAAILNEQPEYNVYYPEDFEDIFNEEFFLSQGFGVTEETTEDIISTNSISPLDIVSNNPGEKPYPSESDWTEGGKIIRNTYGEYSGNSFFNLEKAGQVNNKTLVPNETLINETRYLPDFSIKDTDKPQVLIYHTHTTESFEPYVRDFYDASFNYRTTDETKNIVMVGEEIRKQLEANGIGVIHAKNIHDYPSYNGSYERSRNTITPILEKYPSIKVALDIHRDAISSDGTAYQPFSIINGREAAQIMIISGCDDGTLGMPNYIKNFRFASFLQQQLESDHPGLTRPILFDYRKYNQDLTTGSLLIEVGSHGNTLDQVQYSGYLIGESLAKALNSLK